MTHPAIVLDLRHQDEQAFTPDPGDDPNHQEEHHRYLALRKVRHTILRLLGDHYRRPQGTHRSWQGCDLDLTSVIIDGNMDFHGATFSDGRVSFSHTTFSDNMVDFSQATFSGSTVSFDGATFSGNMMSFIGATFSDNMMSFGEATFSGSTVDFSYATGPTPYGLLAAVGTPVPATVTLPPAWLPSNP